jgi:hypothetical protein
MPTKMPEQNWRFGVSWIPYFSTDFPLSSDPTDVGTDREHFKGVRQKYLRVGGSARRLGIPPSSSIRSSDGMVRRWPMFFGHSTIWRTE